MRRLRKLLVYVRSGKFRLALKAISTNFYSNRTHIGLRRLADLATADLPARFSFELRPIESRDLEVFSPAAEGSDADARDLVDANALFEAGVQTCYVAVTGTGQVCFKQHIIDASQNARLRSLFGDLIPPLEPDQVLFEGAYTLPRYRGRGIILHVWPEMARIARESGARELLSYPSVGDEPILRVSKWFGFEPFVMRHERYRLFRRSVTFVPLPEGSPYPSGARNGVGS